MNWRNPQPNEYNTCLCLLQPALQICDMHFLRKIVKHRTYVPLHSINKCNRWFYIAELKVSPLQYIPLLALLFSVSICEVLYEFKGQRMGRSWLLLMRSCKIQPQVTV